VTVCKILCLHTHGTHTLFPLPGWSQAAHMHAHTHTHTHIPTHTHVLSAHTHHTSHITHHTSHTHAHWYVCATHTHTHTHVAFVVCLICRPCLHALSLKQAHGSCSTDMVWCWVSCLVCLCSSFAHGVPHYVFTAHRRTHTERHTRCVCFVFGLFRFVVPTRRRSHSCMACVQCTRFGVPRSLPHTRSHTHTHDTHTHTHTHT